MADKKISELTQILGSAVDDANDELAIVDTSETTTKAITRAELLSGISNLSLGAISETITATAVDVFVYDTSQDSDGGAWRKRMQNRSWYNETLNTATRGATRDIPSVPFIVAEASEVTIYNADDPALPMWRVEDYTGLTITSVDMVNGKLVIGTTTGVVVSDYAADELGSTTLDYTTTTSPAIINNSVNDVAMTVLSGAPIDAATGLAVPTIAVATDGGVSVINNDGTVADSSNPSAAGSVDFTDSGSLVWCLGGATERFYQVADYSADGFTQDIVLNPTASPSLLRQGLSQKAISNAHYGDAGLCLIDAGSTASNTSVAYITDEYNTGWMQGDIKGAFLSSTDTASLVGTNLQTNGDFATNDLTGWTDVNSHWSAATGAAVHPASTVFNQLRTTDISAYANQKLYIEFSVSGYSGTAGLRLQFRDASGSPASGDSTIWGAGGLNPAVTANGEYSDIVPVPADAVTIAFARDDAGGTAATFTIDDVRIRPVDDDRSVNDNPLAINGTITRTAVATGAELVGYSGFSASNYLEQPYNADLDFGTGDFCVTGWINDGAGSEVVLQRGIGANVFYLYTSSGALRFGVGASIVTGSLDVSGSQYRHFAIVRRAGVGEIWVDGVLDISAAAADSVTNASSILQIGDRSLVSTSIPFGGSLALLRIGAGAPTAAQIKKMYEDEKYLFQENADAVLTNSTVAALAFDPDTNLLHVGGDVGRDEFQGLRRTATTAGAVTSAISAQDNLVATGKATTVDVVKPGINLREILTKLSS